MKIREIMSTDPAFCLPSESAQNVARIMRNRNIGAVPVLYDLQSRKLMGMITDRDLCMAIVAEGLHPATTLIKPFVTLRAATCHENANVEDCERLMQEHQVRRIPVLDDSGRLVGIVAQADLALRRGAESVHKTLREVSKTERPSMAA